MPNSRVIEKGLEAGRAYRRHELSLDDYKARLWRTAQETEAVEDWELRGFLKHAEGDLDRLQFTVDTGLLFERTLEVVARVDARLQREQGRG